MPFGLNIGLEALPPWLEDIYRRFAERNQALAQDKYPHYEGPVLAQFPEHIEHAIGLAKGSGEYKPYFHAAEGNLGKGVAQFPAHAQEYMNPYIANVVEQLSKLGGRTLKENILPQIQAQFVGLGQQRSVAHDEERRRATRDLEEAVLREQNKALMSGYGEAGQLFTQDKLRQLEGARRQAELGRYAQAGQIADIDKLLHVGGLQQQQKQNVMNENRQEFLRQAFYPHQMAVQQAGLMQGIPQQGIAAQGLYNPAPQVAKVNAAGQIGGLAANLYGMAQYAGHKEGGAIHPSSRLKKKIFGLSDLKFKSHNKQQKNTDMKYRKFNRGM